MGNYTYRVTWACGWEAEAQTKAERDRVDEEHLEYRRDNPDSS
jgi:hypothetical protein